MQARRPGVSGSDLLPAQKEGFAAQPFVVPAAGTSWSASTNSRSPRRIITDVPTCPHSLRMPAVWDISGHLSLPASCAVLESHLQFAQASSIADSAVGLPRRWCAAALPRPAARRYSVWCRVHDTSRLGAPASDHPALPRLEGLITCARRRWSAF